MGGEFRERFPGGAIDANLAGKGVAEAARFG